MQPEGYGDKYSAEGHGCPVGLEIWQGRLRLIVFDDINEEDPQIFDLENARETARHQGDQPADEAMDKSFIGQTGIVSKRSMHFPDLAKEEDLWTVEFASGKSDAFFTEEMIRVDQNKS